MPGPMSVPTTGNINTTGFTTLFNAFKQLTVGRAENRGTLEAVKDKNGRVVELKCSQHRFLSGKVQADNFNTTELRGMLKDAVSKDLDFFNLKMKNDLAGSKRGVTFSRELELDHKLKELKSQIERMFADVFKESDKVLLRKDIGNVILKVDDIKRQIMGKSIGELLSCGLEKLDDGNVVLSQAKPQNQEKVPVRDQPLALDEALTDIHENVAKIHNAKVSKENADAIQNQPQSIEELPENIFENAVDISMESEPEPSQKQENVSVKGQPLNLDEIDKELPDNICENAADISRESELSVIENLVAPLEGEKVEVPESKDFTDDDMAQVNEIASFAYGSSEKSSGGEGYMGVLNGTMTKFLTHHGERKNIGWVLTEPQKKLANDSTEKLRAQLLQLAGKLEDGQEKGEILRLLAKNEKAIAEHNGLDLLSRKDVAKVVTLLAKGAQKAGKSIFSWKDVKPAATVKDTTFETLLVPAEIRQAEAEAISDLSKPAYIKNKEFVEFLADPVKVAKAADEIDKALEAQGLKSAIIDCRSVDLTQKNPVRNLKQQFSFSGQYTAETAQTLMAAGNEKMCMQIYADGHYFACGLPQGWDTQEESVLANTLDPKMAAWMLKHGFITKTVHEDYGLRYEYSGLSTVGGGYLLNDPLSGKCYSFFSMPSLTKLSDSFDLNGNVNWLCEARRLATGKEMTAEQRANATKFIAKFYERTKNGGVGLDLDQYRAAMKYLLFAGDDANFNVFAHQQDADVEKEIDKFLAFVDATNKKDPEALEKVAQPAYERTVGESLVKLIAMASSFGVKNFIGGLIGTGAFYNAPEDVARFVKKALEEHAGDMKYFCCGSRGNEDIKGTCEHTFKKVIVGE